MLETLSIRDVVLIDRLNLSFSSGLCALTGETGAGKSIVLDSLSLALGSRADQRLIRHGCDQAVVAASFHLKHDHPAIGILRDHGVEFADGELVVRRVIGRDGRSRAFVNDQSVSATLLRRLGEVLVEIHGQFESQRLLEPSTHRALLDAFGKLDGLCEACETAWGAWRQAVRLCQHTEAEVEAAQKDEDYLRHALGELDELEPHPHEEEELASGRIVLQNAEKTIAALSDASETLKGGAGRGVQGSLNGALRTLQRVADKTDGRLDDPIAALERALTDIIEADALLDRLLGDSDLDPRRLEEIEERLFALRRLARKHNVSVDELCRLRGDFASRLAALDHGAGRLQRLKGEEIKARKVFREAATRLSEARVTAAGEFDERVARELEPLRLGKADFITRVSPLNESDWAEHGCDRVVFEVATNPGMPPGPLSRIASGGELSRFMLALKVVLADADPVTTLVFDEVDAGVGGAVAAAVGDRLAQLAETVQVLVVTHSPQVAARGHAHWRISKSVTDGTTRTTVDPLGDRERREEIARMLAGAKVTEEARAAADSLLAGAPT